MLLAQLQEDLVSMFIWQLGQGDIAYNNANGDNYALTSGFYNNVAKHLTVEQMELFDTINTDLDLDAMEALVIESSFKVIKSNRDIVMAEGYHQVDGAFDTSQMVYRIYNDGEQIHSQSCFHKHAKAMIGQNFLRLNAPSPTTSVPHRILPLRQPITSSTITGTLKI